MRNKEKKIKEKKIKEKKIKENKLEELADNSSNEIEEPKRGLIESFNMYKFILKCVAAVLLLAFAIVILVSQDEAVFVLLFVTGGVSLLSGLIRLIALAKSNRCREAKIITLCETLIHIVLGGYLIVSGFIYRKNPETAFSTFNKNYYGMFLAAILYVKAVAYFWGCVLYKSNTTKFMFWLHIIFVTVAVLFAAFSDRFGAGEIVITLAVIALLCALLVGGEAGTGYYRYRRSLKPRVEKKKEKKDKKENGLEAPARDDSNIISEIDPNIIPKNDNDTDSSIVS